MTSFTKQFRAGIGAIARESLDESLALPAEEVDATLAEPVAAEIEQEVVAPAAEISDGVDALNEAEGDAETLDNTAAILADSAAGEGEGVDAPGAEMAALTLERIVNKYSLNKGKAFSKESFAPAGRKQATLSLAREAEDASKSLKDRVVAGIKAVIDWITNLIKSIFDKRTKLAKRAAALQTRIGEVKGVQAKGSKIKFGGSGAMLGGKVADEPALVVEALKEFIGGLSDVKTMAEDTVKSNAGQTTGQDQDFNPKGLGGFTLKAGLNDGKFVVTKESADGESAGKEITALDLNVCKRTVKAARDALEALAEGEAALKATVAAMNGGIGKIRSVVTGKDGEGTADRSKILARYTAISKLSGTIAGTTLTVVATGLGAVEKSLATFKTEAAK